jgi:hypothetical protein
VATKDYVTARHLFTASHGVATSQRTSLGPVKSPRDSAHTDGSLLTVEPELVEIAQLVPAGSPRSDGEDSAHVERLVEASWPLPHILMRGSDPDA